MFNVGGPEVLVILLVALIVLGPQQLPKAVRSVGNVMAELRRMSSGFQDEIRNAMDAPIEADAREQGAQLARTPRKPTSPRPSPATTTPCLIPTTPTDARPTDTDGRTPSAGVDPHTDGEATGERPPIVTNPSDRAAG